MKINVKNEDNNTAIITVETEAGRAKEAYKATVKKFADQIDLPGFRKGKAPISAIENKVGKETLKAETLNMYFISELLYEAFREEKLEVIFIQGIQGVEFEDPDGVVKIEAKIELAPEVKLGDFGKIKVEVEVPEFDKEQNLKDTLARVAGQFANFETVEDAIQLKDEIVFDFDGSVFKGEAGEEEDESKWEAQAGMQANDYQIIVEPGRFIENFLEQMVGMKAGEEKTLDVTFPEAYHAEDLAGKPAKFKVKVHKVSRPNAPEIDDELAKKTGNEDLESMKTAIIAEMEKYNEHHRKDAAAEAVLSQLADDSEVEVTDGMVEREIDGAISRMAQQHNWAEQQIKEFKDSIDMDKEKETARVRLAKGFIISKIIKDNNLEVTQEEINEEVQKMMQNPNYNMDQISDVNQLKQNLNQEILSVKALDLITEAADVSFKEIKHVHDENCQHA